MYAIKTEIHNPSAETFTFNAQKTMYGGKHIAEGDPIFLFASENEGGTGLIASGVVTAAEAVPKKSGIERQTPRVSITVRRTALIRQRLGRAELKPFSDWDDGQPETELNFKFYRQATNKIVGISNETVVFLRGFFYALMSNPIFRWLAPDEVAQIAEIDRSERIRTGYRYVDGNLERLDVNWDSPAWHREGTGNYTVASQIAFCQGHLDRGGRMYGAFVGDKLAGIGLFTPDIAPDTAQLAFLHVSKPYRKSGIGKQIVAVLITEARKSGASKMYVSATPSGSAVGFYRSEGFEPTDTPIPELFALEPEDIHMVRKI